MAKLVTKLNRNTIILPPEKFSRLACLSFCMASSSTPSIGGIPISLLMASGSLPTINIKTAINDIRVSSDNKVPCSTLASSTFGQSFGMLKSFQFLRLTYPLYRWLIKTPSKIAIRLVPRAGKSGINIAIARKLVSISPPQPPNCSIQ